jgi:predicted GH43/DUF377 family glycosyl hydrolase
MRTAILTLLLSSGCIRISNLPDLGECADYPAGTYEYGQIDIGLCISGPNSMRFVGEDDQLTLLVTNSNPYRLFSGGSLLAIPWANVDLGDETNEIHTLAPYALELPNFAAGLAINGDMGLIGIRESEDARTRVWDDSVLLLDLNDPEAPGTLNRGEDGTDSVTVMSDPVDIVVDKESGMAFVANRTSHKISVLDLTGDEVVTIDPWPEAMVTAAVYKDNSGTGGSARLVTFDIADKNLLPDETWTLTWVEGTWRVWTPDVAGLTRHTTHMARDEAGTVVSTQSPMGTDLPIDDAPVDVTELRDPHFFDLEFGRMLFSTGTDIWGASTGEFLGDWNFDNIPSLSGKDGDWNANLGGPSLVPGIETIWMFFDGQASDEGAGGASSIGGAESIDGLNWALLRDPVLEPTHPHEGQHIADPHVFFDGETGLWRMMYSAFDGEQWTIGHAISEGLETWTSDDTAMVFSGQGAAAPAIHGSVGSWHLWYSEWDGSSWQVASAWSPDTVHWTPQATSIRFDPETILDDHLRPPGLAISGSATDAFRVEGEHLGSLQTPLLPGLGYAAPSSGWNIEVLAGAWLDLGDAGAESNGGIQVDSVEWNDNDTASAWLTLTTRNERTRIGHATMDENGRLTASYGAVFDGGNDKFERDGVSHPVVFQDDGSYTMLYAGSRSGRHKIGAASSEDGLNWTADGQAFSTGNQDWDAISVVPGSVNVLDSGGWRLWYSGFDGSRWRIGSATSADGRKWTRDEAARGYQFTAGEPGAWDDSGVRDPFVIQDADGEHLWYSGSDGSNWRIGYAFRAAGTSSFERTILTITEEARSVVGLAGGLFHRGGVSRPVVHAIDDGYAMLFAGSTAGNVRVGKAFGIDPAHFNKMPNRPRLGDQLIFDTQKGDADMHAIPLDGFHADRTTTGIGLTALHLDTERGMLFAVSKLHATIFVIDVRDDTDAAAGFYDRNYLDVEALILLNTSSSATGFRQILTLPGSDRMYALVDSPESIVSIDLSGLVDDEYADAMFDVATGYLAAARGDERDKGHNTMSSVGPGQMLLHPDGNRMFVSNFNRNSITTYDLRLGPYGLPVRETPHVGENPYALALAPNDLLVFSNYVGEVENDVSHSSVGVIDINATSPTYLEVLSWVVNR